MADTLREYLIALGFQVDENGWRGFNEKLTQSAKNVQALGRTTVAMAAEIGVAVEQVARHYEDLYYMSQRTGQSASFIQANVFGMRQIGLTAEQAKGAIEGMASAMRLNPGLAALADGMGAKTPVDLVEKLKNSGMQYFVAQRMASMYGLDEQTFQHVWNNLQKLKAEQESARQRQINAGLDPDKLADSSVKFMTALRTLTDELSTLEDKTISVIIDPATRVVKVLGDVVHQVNAMNASLGGTIGVLANLALAWGGARLGLGVLARLGILGGAVGGAGASLGLGGAVMGVLAPAAAFGWGLGLGGQANASERNNAGRGAGPAPGDTSPEAMAWRAHQHADSSTSGAMQFFMSQGWSKEQAAGIVANLQKESAMRPEAVGDGGAAYGLAQWHPDRQADFARWAGHDIRSSTAQEQLAFVHHELTQGKEQLAGRALKNAGGAQEAGSIVSRMYERPQNVTGEAQERGGLADRLSNTPLTSSGGNSTVIISPKTETNIHGVSDPKKVSELVGGENDRLYGNITRWGKSAVA